MYVSAGVGGVVTVLPVVEHHVKSHYFLDQPCIPGTHFVKAFSALPLHS